MKPLTLCVLAVVCFGEIAALAADVKPGPVNLEEGRKWWAFQPVKDAPEPAVHRADWAKNSIDKFILAKLEEKHLAPAPQADKRVLIRRAYYDLIGLPPTPAEVDAFLADNSSDAFAKVVDHLLSLPQYGERWGRHWLDVVRYTDSLDSRGMGGESDVPFAYRYRDWVVNAFNNDLPYDRFIKDQIAGDLMPDKKDGSKDKDALIATGVYSFGEWGIGDADKEKVVTDIVDDQIDLTGRAFLGLTLACARCHDHKFDPIPTKDYYGLAGIFFSTHIMPNPGAKGAGAPIMRVPLLSERELAQRKTAETRIVSLQKDIDKSLDDEYAKLASDMVPKVDTYLAAAWEYKNLANDRRGTINQFAQERNLRGYELSRWLEYVGAPSLKLFAKAMKDVNGMKGVDAWRNADGADTPVVLSNTTDAAVQIATLTLPPRSISMHPSPSAGVAVAWKSPISGRVKITGKVADGDGNCGDGITWSLTRVGGTNSGEIASGNIANGGKQNLVEGTGGSSLASVEVSAGEMIQLAILPKADYSCDTTNVEVELTELNNVAGNAHVWDLVKDVVPDLHHGNPHPDSYGNPQVWLFHDMAGQARAVFAAGSAMSKFTASLATIAGADGSAIRTAAEDVRAAMMKTAELVKSLKASGKDTTGVANPDLAFYDTLTAPRGTFWIAARNDDTNLPDAARTKVAGMRNEMSAARQTIANPVPMTHGMQEGGTPTSMFAGIQDVPVHIRGSYARLGDMVPRHFPTVIAGENQPPIKDGSGRKQLADWIASEKNPLTARVIVNRIWQQHFGEGLVRTANNFGRLGTPPTHPELLDHLAATFLKHGWSMKALHREIMLSATYQQASESDAATMKADPDNLLLGRMNRRRLDAEALRDSLLAVTDKLDKTVGGPAINDLNTQRRTLYVMTVRSDRSTYRNLFDAADAGAIVEKRIDSTVAPQALFLMNNPFALTQTKFLAERVLKQPGDDAAKIGWLYQTLFCRPATKRETEIGVTALSNARKPQADEKISPELPWEAYCQVLLCTNEFIYVD